MSNLSGFALTARVITILAEQMTTAQQRQAAVALHNLQHSVSDDTELEFLAGLVDAFERLASRTEG